MKPIVSIIMATYNRANLISESLLAIKNQNYKTWECIIIDDGSNDDTVEKVASYTETDSRFKYFHRPDKHKKGLPGCRNYGLDKADGNYIVFFDDDDIPHPQLLELAVKELNNEKYDYFRYERSTFNSEFQGDFNYLTDYHAWEITIEDLGAIIRNEIPFNSCQILWRKSAIGKKRFEECLMFAEEWEFYSRLLSKGLKGISIDQVLYFGRKHANSNTGEFENKDPQRVRSKIRAAVLIISHLSAKNLFNHQLKKYFIRLGFQLKSKEIIDKALFHAGSGITEKIKYQIGYWFYPILRPLFILKGKFNFS